MPAFAGLGAPYWDQYARGTIVGLTRGSGRAELARAALEAAAYQTRDVVEAMENDAGIALTELRVDGGMVVNNWLMQFQADMLGVAVHRPARRRDDRAGRRLSRGPRDRLLERAGGDRAQLGSQDRVFTSGDARRGMRTRLYAAGGVQSSGRAGGPSRRSDGGELVALVSVAPSDGAGRGTHLRGCVTDMAARDTIG